jgi:hypothetical protein
MDQRNAIRVEVNGQVCGKMVLVESLEILDISMTGIRFRSKRRMDMNILHRIKIEKGDISVVFRGSIVRATFMGLQQGGGDTIPVYEVAMHFENMSDSDRASLERLIAVLCHE